MARIEHTFIVQRPVTLVYGLLTDFKRLSDWQPDLLSVHLTSADPLRVGTMMSQERRFGAGQTFLNVDMLEVARNQALEYSGLHGRFRLRRRIELSSQGGATQVKDVLELRIPLLWSLVSPLYAATLRRQTADEWRRFKALLEGQSSSSSPIP
ncbi:MAG: SRPBCC family protein [Anaerolineae bacterium]|nr:SRPBCC family protein [Anaerolineae bacterium]MDW8171919.1 SRPBCC family protein [Anaerolineae bacterium]